MRNFIYRTSDVIVAIIIIAAAAGIIFWRVDCIMDYSTSNDTVAAVTADSSDDQETSADTADSADSSGTAAASETAVAEGETAGTAEGEAAASEADASGVVTIEIAKGSSIESIASVLCKAGLISDEAQFAIDVKNAGVESQLRYGTFEIPQGATVAQILEILSK